MYKRTLALLIVVLIILSGAIRVNADSCKETGSKTYSNCEGDNCYKSGATGPHLIIRVMTTYDCWTDDGRYYTTTDPGMRQNSGCC